MTHIKIPTKVPAAGTKPKIIEEFIGLVNSNTDEVSIARMKSPAGWIEPPQTPEFNEYTVVLKGAVHILINGKETIVRANEAFIAEKGAEVQYSTPGPDGAEYIAVCVPAFSIDKVHRKG
jgi:mannose-6-phosphate isomerase-like protein (cupin superfamily)